MNDHLEKLAPVVCVGISVIIFTPILGIVLPFKTALVLHTVSYLILGVCFEVPETSLNILCLRLARNKEALAGGLARLKSFLPIRYVLTHFVAPCSGILSVTSGIYLVAAGSHSYHEAWVFWITTVSTIGFYKGMLQHNSYVKALLNHAALMKGAGDESMQSLRAAIRNPFDQVLIFLELPTYIFNYWAAYAKPVWPNPFDGFVTFVEQLGTGKAVPGIVVLVLGSVLIVPLMLSISKFR